MLTSPRFPQNNAQLRFKAIANHCKINSKSTPNIYSHYLKQVRSFA